VDEPKSKDIKAELEYNETSGDLEI